MTHDGFKPPTPDQIKTYAEKLGYEGFEVFRFWAYHEARGWPRHAWKRAIVTWQQHTLQWQAEARTHPTVFGHAPGWDRRPDEALAQEGVDLEALRKAREAEK